MDKIDICKKTREIAAQALAATLQNLLSTNKQISEKELADAWLGELRKNQSIFPDGWYTPPPHGIGVLFGTTERNSRHNYPSLRPEEMWPKEDVFLDRENSMAYLYASPVDRESGIIGDFGLTLYFGNDQKIKEHLRACLSINKQIFDYIEVGKKFSEVYNYAEEITEEHNFSNGTIMSADPANKNLGHAVPVSYFDWTKEEKDILGNADSDWESFKNMLRSKCVFVSPVEKMVYKEGMAVTLEPRFTEIDNPHIPMGSFHTIVAIKEDGSKELLTNFDDVFKAVGMDFMLK